MFIRQVSYKHRRTKKTRKKSISSQMTAPKTRLFQGEPFVPDLGKNEPVLQDQEFFVGHNRI